MSIPRLEMARNDVRERTYRATTLYKEYIALLQGLSRAIMGISDDVKILRGRLVVSTRYNCYLWSWAHTIFYRQQVNRTGDQEKQTLPSPKTLAVAIHPRSSLLLSVLTAHH